jgi:hypothetical protein
MVTKKILLLGLAVALFSLTTAEASAQGHVCDGQRVRDAIQVVEEYTSTAVLENNDNLAFKIYTLAVIEHLQYRLDRQFCSPGRSQPKLKITIIFRPFYATGSVPWLNATPSANPIVLTTQGRTLISPWVQIAQNDQTFEAIYIFNERQVIYDQAKLANPELPINEDLRPIPPSVVYWTYSDFLRTQTIKEKNFQELSWLFKLVSRTRARPDRIPVGDVLLQASPGYAILANFLTNHFFSNGHPENGTYRDITSLPKRFNRDSYRLNGVIWDSYTAPW